MATNSNKEKYAGARHYCRALGCKTRRQVHWWASFQFLYSITIACMVFWNWRRSGSW